MRSNGLNAFDLAYKDPVLYSLVTRTLLIRGVSANTCDIFNVTESTMYEMF
jgi:hypothetical protein